MHTLVITTVNLRVTLELPIFTHTKDINTTQKNETGRFRGLRSLKVISNITIQHSAHLQQKPCVYLVPFSRQRVITAVCRRLDVCRHL